MNDLIKDAGMALALLALVFAVMHMDLSWMFHVEPQRVVSAVR